MIGSISSAQDGRSSSSPATCPEDISHPGVLERRDQLRLGREGKGGDGNAGADDRRDPLSRVRGIGSYIHSERSRGSRGRLPDRRLQLGQAHGGRGQDAEAARVAHRRDQPRPRHVAHRAGRDRVAEFGGTRADGELAAGNQLEPNSPFGGFGQSGLGREGGRAAIESYTELKTVLLPLTDEMM